MELQEQHNRFALVHSSALILAMLERAWHKQFLPSNRENRQPELQTWRKGGKNKKEHERMWNRAENGRRALVMLGLPKHALNWQAVSTDKWEQCVCVCVHACAPVCFLCGFRNKGFTLTTSKLEHKMIWRKVKKKRKTFPQLLLI